MIIFSLLYYLHTSSICILVKLLVEYSNCSNKRRISMWIPKGATLIWGLALIRGNLVCWKVEASAVSDLVLVKHLENEQIYGNLSTNMVWKSFHNHGHNYNCLIWYFEISENVTLPTSGIYLAKVNVGNTRTINEILSLKNKDTGVFIVNFEQIWQEVELKIQVNIKIVFFYF